MKCPLTYVIENINMIPDFYTSVEGDNWKVWPQEVKFQKSWLKLRSLWMVKMGDLEVHSLAFGDPAAGIGDFLRWDCINGLNF